MTSCLVSVTNGKVNSKINVREVTVMKLLGALTAFLLCGGGAMAADRISVPLDQGWRFAFGTADGAEAASFDDHGWSQVTLPHSWNHMGGTAQRQPDYNNMRGAGWYRLSVTPPAEMAGKRLFLQFDGASIVTDLWVNGQKIGNHQGAFGRFRFDVTDALQAGRANLVAVRTDNSSPNAANSPTAEISPMSGDFFMFGGLYRTVSLVATDPLHVDMLDDGGPGIYAHAAAVDANNAAIAVAERIRNDGAQVQTVSVKTAILDAAGAEVAAKTETISVQPGQTAEPRADLSIAKPHLWNGRKDAYLYQVAVTLSSGQGVKLDEMRQPLGVRTYHIDADKGFFLNGDPVALHGVSRHQDRPGKGWAISAEDQRQDMDIMLDLGINTLRLAHYQHDQTIYDLADRAGIVTWAEIPLVDRTAPKGMADTPPDFTANAESQLRELIKQNFNHPSVFVWSIGNEVNLRATKPGEGEHAKPLLNDLNALAHTLDPSRPTTMADCCEGGINGPEAEMLAGITDVFGYNRYQGWYYQTAQDLGPVLDRYHQEHPAVPLSVSEYGAGGALSQHSDDAMAGVVFPKGHFHPEEYESRLHEIWYRQLKARPYLWATWVWNMFDFVSDSRNEGDLVDTNDKGLVSFDRKTRKDVFYFYQAQWSGKPVLHLNGSRYVERNYGVADVEAYSNAKTVRLSAGGKDLGAVRCADFLCVWHNVKLGSATTLTASAEVAGKPITDSVTWHYSGQPGVFNIRSGSSAGGQIGGKRYGSDAFVTGGQPIDRHPQPGPDNPYPQIPAVGEGDQVVLFETYREGKFTYAIPVSPGRYQVTLRFFAPTSDERVFDVAADGVVKLRDVDVAAAAGGVMKPVERSFTVDVKGKELKLDFRPKTGQAIVSAVEIQPSR
jgi:beta-galactosidase